MSYLKQSCVFLAAALLAAMATPRMAAADEAACLSWRFPERFEAVQSNDTDVGLRLRLEGTDVLGSSSYLVEEAADTFSTPTYRSASGSVDGTLKGDDFNVTIYWSDGTIGVYTGKVGPRGRIEGSTFDRVHPETRATWYSNPTLICASRASPPAPPVPTVGLWKIDRSAGPSDPSTICDSARTARARNSPAAPGLEAQCKAQTAAKTSPPQAVQSTQPPVARPAFATEWLDQQAARGEELTQLDPLALALRSKWTNVDRIRAFNIGMAEAETDTLPGPGKKAVGDALGDYLRGAYDTAVLYSIGRNANADLIKVAQAMAENDPDVREGTSDKFDPFYRLGFMVATGLFGDPAAGARGNTLMGPGSRRIRDALNSPSASKGFDAAVAIHQTRNYQPVAQ